MWLVIEARSDAVKSSIARTLERQARLCWCRVYASALSPGCPLPHLTAVCLFCTSPPWLACSRQGVSGSLRGLGLCSPPGSSVGGISQARTLEWVAIPFSRGSSRPGGQTRVSCLTGRFFTSWAIVSFPALQTGRMNLFWGNLTFLYGSAAEATSANLYRQRFSMENQKCTTFWKGLGKQGV